MRRCWVCCLRRPFYKQKTAKSKRRRKSRRYSRVPLKMYLLSLKAKVVITLTVTHNCVEKNVCFSTCFRVLHPNVLRNLYFDSPIGRSMPSFVDKTMEGIPALRSLLCDLTWRFWVVKQWEQWHSQPFVDLWPLRRFDTSSNFSKLVGKILTMSFDRRRWTTTSFKLFILIWVKKRGNCSSQNSNNRSITNHGICRRWQLLQSALTMHLNAILSGRCQGEDTRLSTNENFPFLEKRGIHFVQGYLHPHYFSFHLYQVGFGFV